ncbi:MAG: thiamine-phosphate kinase [Alphaproteobacteria bacterium]|nr:thiamine-phosphate kinase [Alphaproteobacteria bacterium]
MTSSGSNRLGEFEAIAKLFAPLAAKEPGALSLTDDAAILDLPFDEDLVVTVDALIEGVHFLRDDPPATIAKKSLRVNLSDLAAKGATPRAYLLSLSLASWVGDDWLTQFARGLGEDQEQYGIALIGGDTTATPGPLTISITALGSIAKGMMIRRSGAVAGDCVFVTGTIGDAGAGLAVLKGGGGTLDKNERAALIARYRIPQPRSALGPRLLYIASAAIDVSDGLIADLAHIAETSGVRIVVEAARVPLSDPFREMFGGDDEAIIRAATAGDDYEIAFTAAASARARIEGLGFPITEIGRVEKGEGVVLLSRDGKALKLSKPGFTHF